MKKVVESGSQYHEIWDLFEGYEELLSDIDDMEDDVTYEDEEFQYF